MEYRLLTDEEIYRANSVNIIDYVDSLNLKYKKAGKTFKVDGFGGLYVDPLKNRWYCFSKGIGGGPIQLVKFLEGKSWLDSVKTLLEFQSCDRNRYERNTFGNSYNNEKENDKDKEFILPEKNKTFNHVIAYLIKTRGIDKDVVYKFIKNKMLYEDKKRNCVFVGYDKENKPRYAGLRGTNTSFTFKGEVKNSNKEYSFSLSCSDSNKLFVFESPIELMSYMSIYKIVYGEEFRDNALSLGGVTDVVLNRFLKDNEHINEIYLCLNSDEAGMAAAEGIKEKYKDYYKIIIKYPKLKDYNEDLINIYRNIQGYLEKKEDVKDSEESELEL